MSDREGNDTALKPFWSHIEDLRILIIRCFFVILTGAVLSFFFSDHLILLLKQAIPQALNGNVVKQVLEIEKHFNPSNSFVTIDLPFPTEIRFASKGATPLGSNRYTLAPKAYLEVARPKEPATLFLLSPTEGFTTILKLSFWMGALCTVPFWIYLILKFIEPGLIAQEKAQLVPTAFLSLALALLGLAIAYCVTLPLSNHYLFSFNQGIGENHWGLSYYIDYVLTFLFGHGVAFASASLLFLAVYYQWISAARLAAHRRHVIIAILVLSALLTPPDVLSQIMLALPLMLVFEIVLLYAKISERKKASIRP
ncbi:Sec-independent protein translocase protein TatC [Chlamydiales bacterium STE3]|nr:Sec-independent protein translocase protein TatC [Chlamydiales bacterium STE3]